MVGTIIPIGYGDTHRTQYIRKPAVVLAHLAGTTVGATAFGVAVGTLGMLLKGGLALAGYEQLMILVTGTLALLYGGHELKIFRLPAPQSSWQVPEKWRAEMSPGWASFFYGAGLGPGLFTAIPFTTFYLILAWVLVSASPTLGALCFAVYGVGRATPVFLMFYLSEGSKQVFQLSREADLWQPVVHLFSGLALCVAGTCLIVGAFTAAG
ncbi:MAG TPA: hypothetical protein VGB76_16915 [Pyrinomonadaceae bacterium]|jgi:cytochrome c biogenesis protein CcdA